MLRKPLFWLAISLLCLAGGVYFWRQGEDKRRAEQPAPPTPAQSAVQPASAAPAQPAAPAPAPAPKPSASAATARDPRYPYRLSNTDKTTGQLLKSPTAIHLMNALIDTAKPVDLGIPERLRAPKDNGSYVVQARGPIDDNFRAQLASAGAVFVSYIPNNACIVRVSDAGAQQLAATAQSVLPWEPYYKLDPSLLKSVMEDTQPASSAFKVTLFPDASPSILSALNIRPMATDRSPFGQVVTVPASADALVEIARLPGVQLVEPAYPRKRANDLSRTTLGVSADTLATTPSYLGLSGSNIMVNINDSSVDATHPDLTGRIFADTPADLTDVDGHGTHVAGTILGNGSQSATVTNASGSVIPGASFRGMATNANAFVISLDQSDSYLQEQAARTNSLISNNSWNYADSAYDIEAASYDAAVRDALPEVTGPQSIVYVFSAGNNGGGTDDGQNGAAGSVLSPATAKNVISVGAVEQFRNITNAVVENGVTNEPFLPSTDTSDQVASFSSRGNVGVGVEGDAGRFKPDLVAPGTFVISTRSAQWDTNAYYDPTNVEDFPFPNQSVDPGTNAPYLMPVPANSVLMFITVKSNLLSPSPFPNMPIWIGVNAAPNTNNTPVGFNRVVLPTNAISLNFGDTIFIYVGNGTNTTVNFDLDIRVLETNADLAVLQAKENLNNSLSAPPQYYRYESGTSMAAAGISGMLACMEEFFNSTLKISNASPALMKALLINGARSLSSPGQPYDFQVSDTLNIQGWGLANLPNSIPPALTNYNSSTSNTMPVLFFDQDPANALATGQSKTRTFSLSPDAQNQALRITLVWTDPPGNPAAGVKLVNDLDLIVSNTATGDVYYGNDIPAGSIYNEIAVTNGPAPADAVNNVENVYLPPQTGTNFSVTVLGHHVNVNAVTLNTNNIAQDYALVISSGDAGVTATSPFQNFTDTTPVVSSNNVSPVTTLINDLPLLNERVGANSQYAATTNGITNAWNFYVFTNTAAATNGSFTNVAFITFFPPNLGVPRMGASGEIDPSSTNATRFAGADVDLYVSTDPGLTNLDSRVISNAFSGINGGVSVGRTGDEVVVFTNSTANQVYYIGVKSEDQEGAQYGFAGLASNIPFDQQNQNGDTVVTMMPLPAVIPPGSSSSPKFVLLFGVTTHSQLLRKVVVTNTVTHQNFGDLIGTLTHTATSVTLNNHSFFSNVNDTTETFIYDDSGEGGIPGARPSDGPGSLRSYVGMKSQGAWIFAMVNDSSPTDTGQIDNMQLALTAQPPTNGVTTNLTGGGWFYDFIDVPVNATNLTVRVQINNPNPSSLVLVLKRGSFPTLTSFDKQAFINSPGGQISISSFDSPPLNPGRYYIGVFNPNAVTVNFTLSESYGISTTPAAPFQFLSVGNEPIADDAVTYSTNRVGLSSPVVSAEVGVHISHPRVSDLVLTLVSPLGTRVLLAENRGGLTTNYGSGFDTTNSLVPQNANGNSAPQTNGIILTNGQTTGTLLIDYQFFTVPDDLRVYYGGSRIFDSGLINGGGTFAVDFGPGSSTNLEIIMNEPGTNPSTNTTDAWQYTATVITKGTTYAVFTDDTNKTTLPIKFAVPPFGGGPAVAQPQTVSSSSFDDVTPGNYASPATVDGWSVLDANPVTVVSVPILAASGSNVLALHNGSISTNVTTVPGVSYTLNFAAHGRPVIPAVSWWKGESNALDSIGTNNGTFANDPVYTNGVVGLAFEMDGGLGHVRVPDSSSLEFSNAMTAEAWIYPTNLLIGGGPYLIVTKYDSPIAPVGQSAFTMQIDPNGLGAFYASSDGINPSGPAYSLAAIPQNQWTHLACTYDGANLNVYMNGVQGTPVAFAGPIFPGNDDLGIGDSLGGTTEPILAPGSPFAGLIDETTVYSNALTPLQIQDIYAAGSAGKATNSPVVGATVSIGGVPTAFSAPDTWTNWSITFIASGTSTPIVFTPTGGDGMLLDNITLQQSSTINSSNYYLPEESLSKVVGQSALGDWKLEVLDNRAGPPVTNPVPLLVSWQLNLITETVNPTAAPLEHAIPQTNTVPPNSIVYYVVNVPPWALFATNTLFNVSGGPLNLLFNQNFEPRTTTNGDFTLLANVNPSNFYTLATTNGPPPLIPGQQYYLGVQNPNPAPVSFAIEVDFDITTLTNMVPLTNSLPIGGVQRYYQYDVSTNAIGVEFQLLNVTGNLTLVASKGPPLPTLAANAYSATYVGSPTETILVLSNSLPVPLSPGRWYLGVYNNDITTQNYTIMASELTTPNIIWLTNGERFTTNFPPGPAVTTFFGFISTNSPGAALFELYGLNGNVDLTLDRGTNNFPYGPPAPAQAPYFAGSFNPGTNIEQIVVRTNVALNGVVTSNLNDTWYMGVPNNTGANVQFTIYVVATTNGILPDGYPTTVGIGKSTNGLTFTWPTVAGQTYEIQSSTNVINGSNNWSVLTVVSNAPGTLPYSDSFLLTNSLTGTLSMFYRVLQLSTP